MPTIQEVLTATYAAFNARDIDAVLETMQPGVDWPNGWEGGRVLGHDAVRAYWVRQWEAIDPRVEPVAFDEDAAGRTVVRVHAIMRDRDGNVVFDGLVTHTYTFEDGLICRMDIESE